MHRTASVIDGMAHNGFLTDFPAAIVEFRRNASITKDKDPIAQSNHFRHLRGNHYDAHPALGEFA